MAESIITKLQLAQRQLETAIALFISKMDRVSAITLAGAADGNPFKITLWVFEKC